MSPRRGGKTAECDRADADTRLRQAESFLLVADMVLGEPDESSLALTSVATSLAVLAGIAAADAVCCASLGRRARGQAHAEAVDLVRTVRPGGVAMARDLSRLLAVKDDAQYGVLVVSSERADAAVRWAGRLVSAASTAMAQRP